MVDKYRIFDTPKSWRIRNGVEVPDEYLAMLKKNNNQVIVMFVALMLITCLCGVWLSDYII